MVVLAIIVAFTGAISWYLFQTYYKEEPTPMPEPTPEPPPYTPSAREKLYEVSKACIGKEMSPKDLADDEVACVESLEGVYKWYKGKFISGHTTPLLSTYALYIILKDHPDFVQVTEPEYGDIVVSPTGTGNGKIPHGHCGVVGKRDWMSNDSNTGLWQANFTRAKWYAYYHDKGGYPVFFFRPVDK